MKTLILSLLFLSGGLRASTISCYFTTADQSCKFSPNAASVLAVEFSGTWTGNFQVKVGALAASAPISMTSVTTGISAINITSNGVYRVDVAGMKFAAVSVTAMSSGTATVAMNDLALAVVLPVSLPIAFGTNYIGSVGISSTVEATIGGGIAVTILAGVAGVSVTANQSGPWNLGTAGNVSISASSPLIVTGGVFSNLTVNTHAVTQSGTWALGTAGNVSLSAGASTIGNVGITNTVNVICTSGCSSSEGYSGVSIKAGVAGISVTASITAPTTGQTVHVSNTVATTLSVDSTGLAVNVSNTVATTAPTLTKGTQGSNGWTIQELKNAGRTNLIFYTTAAPVPATTVEGSVTLTASVDTAATGTALSRVIANGKRFRITSITVGTRGHATATAQTTTFRMRINTGGVVTKTSTPIVFEARSATPATASAWDRVIIPIGDGIEFLGNGTMQWGVTLVSTYTTNAPTADVLITGFEY